MLDLTENVGAIGQAVYEIVLNIHTDNHKKNNSNYFSILFILLKSILNFKQKLQPNIKCMYCYKTHGINYAKGILPTPVVKLRQNNDNAKGRS